MGDIGRIHVEAGWGRAEQEALDRCLSVPTAERRAEARSARPSRLARVIETEIIPRLMLAHRPDTAGADRRSPISSAEVGNFSRTVLEAPAAEVLAAADEFIARGCSIRAIFLDLLTPTARLLGDMWRADLCSFADVSIGLSTLQQVLRELDLRWDAEERSEGSGHILLASTPGEQHTFGMSMLECFFRQAGWEVHGGSGYDLDELTEIARDVRLDAIGLSLSADVLFPHARSAISALRAASRNRSVRVLVGGRFFSDHPDRAAEAGADAMAADAEEALRHAQLGLGARLATL